MRRATGFLLIAVVAALSAFTLLQRPPQVGAAPGPADAARRWEYAALRFNLVQGGKWDWISPTESVTDDKLRIFRNLGGQGRNPGGVSCVDIATQAGQQGWEVISVLERERGTEVWFKRPAR